MKAPSANLDRHPLIELSTAFLRRKATGRLDAKRIADIYGEPLDRFARALGVSLAVVTRRPDSVKYQSLLGYFERVARLIPLLHSKDAFASWAKMPQKSLRGKAPIEMLFADQKSAQELVEVVEDVLVGQPD